VDGSSRAQPVFLALSRFFSQKNRPYGSSVDFPRRKTVFLREKSADLAVAPFFSPYNEFSTRKTAASRLRCSRGETLFVMSKTQHQTQ
jgi:hypothetical protein